MFFLAIAGAIALGCLIAYAVVLTVKWIRDKIREKIRVKKAKKVMVADLEQLIEECDNTVSLDALDDLVDGGYTHLMVGVDENNKVVDDVEIIKDKNSSLDEEVEELLGKSGMVVVEG